MARNASWDKATAATRARYDRIAPLYDWMQALPERRYQPWRERLWQLVEGRRVLEVGVGTGKNIPFYPPGMELTAIDLSPAMLSCARARALQLGLVADLRVGDAQDLEFPEDTFDSVVATYVFCSVPDPLRGLQEALRVVKPGGNLFLLEHVRSEKILASWLMDLLNPLVVRLMGPNINRRTVENVRRAGWQVERVKNLGLGDIFKLIVAHRPRADAIPGGTIYAN